MSVATDSDIYACLGYSPRRFIWRCITIPNRLSDESKEGAGSDIFLRHPGEISSKDEDKFVPFKEEKVEELQEMLKVRAMK